jgi:hypothetical protein
LESQGYQVLRFWNHEVETNIGGVEIAIKLALGLLTEDGNDTYDLRDPESGLERLRKKARQLARLRTPRKARSKRRSRQRAGHSVPSSLVGEGQGAGNGGTSEVGSPPTPSPSPQGGGESRRHLCPGPTPTRGEQVTPSPSPQGGGPRGNAPATASPPPLWGRDRVGGIAEHRRLGVPPPPSPSPQGGGESGRSSGPAVETHNE